MASTILVLAAIAVPGFKGARERANTRACYANQKTIIGALEMYSVDVRKGPRTLSPGMLQQLKSDGFLQWIPQDPGQGPGTSGNYQSTPTANGISCRVHGAIE